MRNDLFYANETKGFLWLSLILILNLVFACKFHDAISDALSSIAEPPARSSAVVDPAGFIISSESR